MQSTEKEPWYKSTQWYHFVRSNYVTWFTDWLMGLTSKFAEIVLYATVIYSCAELYPGVTLPSGLNLAVFLLQMGALDIGGIGLNKLAKQARKDKNDEGAHKAELLSMWLIGIMIASLVTASLELAISRIPGIDKSQTAATVIQVAQIIVELILVVARAVCAVLYGKVIHSLKSDAPETILVPTKQADLEAVIIQQLQPAFQQLANIASTVQQIGVSTEARFQQIESTFRVSIESAMDQLQQFQIESQRQTESTFTERIGMLAETIQSHGQALSVLPDFTEQLEQIESASQLQLRTVTEEVTQVKAVLEQQSLYLPKLAEQIVSRRVTTSTTAIPTKASSHRTVISEAKPVDRKAFVFQCLTEDPDMKIEAIRQKGIESGISLSTGTISSYRSEFVEGRTTGEMKAIEVMAVSN